MAELKFPTLEELGRQGGEWALNEFEYKGLTIRQWADKITTEEYQPIKHGEWLEYGEPTYKRCSSCGKRLSPALGIFPQYCPNCGAKMDGGADE